MNAACRWAKRGMKSASNFFCFSFLFPRLLRVGRARAKRMGLVLLTCSGPTFGDFGRYWSVVQQHCV